MTEDQFKNIDSLSETVKSIQNCLQCTICLEMMSSPAKTRCGHTFCRTCIATVLNKKNSKCPLCNASLQRRSISKDKHTGMCINSFERLVRAIREDINIDILSHTKNPRNTREGYPTPKVSQRSTNGKGSRKKSSKKISSFFSKKTPGEHSAGPSNRDIHDETTASCPEYKKDNAIKKDDSAERRNGRKESSSDGLSGVYPLLCSPRKNQNANDEVISTKEERIETWLETLPDTEFLENPLAIPDQEQNCLDDTITVISEFSSVSCEKINIKQENEGSSTTELLTERDSVQERGSDSIKEQRFSKGSSRGGSSTRGKNKGRTTRSFLEKKIKVDAAEHKLKYEKIHEKVRERSNGGMDKSAKTVGDSLISTTDAADSSKHLVEPGNTTRETWNTVVQFGKEMRTKRNKLKSLDVSVQSTGNSRLSDEFVSNRTTKNRRLPSTNFQIRSRIVDRGRNDSIEKQNESGLRHLNESGQRLSSPENQTSFDSKQERKIQQNASFISLDEAGRVPITSLRREQMNDIIGITTENNDTDFLGSTENLAEDHGTVPKKRLSLRKRNECSKNSDRSPAQSTPMKENLDERYELLHGSFPKNIENAAGKSDGISSKTASISKLSLKKRTPNSTNANKVPISYDVSQLSSVKCNLMEQMNRSEVERRESAGNAESTAKIDQKRRNDAREEKKLACDTRTNIVTPPSLGKTNVVTFSKLGKVFRKRRKVKFYKLGSLRRESVTCTLSTSISNASRVNVITLLGSEDTIETSKTFETECNLENGTSGSSISRIDVVDKKNDEVKATKYLPQSQDSLGVLLVSMKDEVPGNKRNDSGDSLSDTSEIQKRNKVDLRKSPKKGGNVSSSRNEIRIARSNAVHSKPVIISVVTMMSPGKDSQLKYLHLDSPSNTIPESTFVQRTTKSKGKSVEKRLANVSEQSDIDSNDDSNKKRKRSSDIAGKVIARSVCERITKNNGRDSSSENDSNCSESSKNVTQIEKLNENVNKRVKAKHTMDGIVSLSSDEDNPKRTKREDATNESRKSYKRIVAPTSSPDTDPGISTKKMNTTDEKKKDKNVLTVKRKRESSADSDSDTIVNEIMTNWCNGLDTSRRSSKKGKLEETRITKATSSRTTVQPPDSLEFDSWNNVLTPVKQDPQKELENRSNNDIIDKVRLIRMNDNIESKSRQEEDAIGDNFDEAMAEVMTHSLGTNLFSSENADVNSREPEKGSPSNKKEENRVLLMSSYVETNDLFAETNRSKAEENSKDFDKTLMENLNESNKENNVKEENARFLRNNGQKDTSIDGVKLTNERKIDISCEGRSTPDLRKYKESKNTNQTEEAKQCYDYDSLMDVTQDQLLLKALEEDLFGTANSRSLAKPTTTKTSSPERRLERESRTPRKMGKRNLGNKDAESSSDENDIIENTPQSRKKFMEVDHGTESKARKSLNVSQTTPVSKNFKATTTTTAMTPSTIVGKLKTPIDQNKIRPLYQSTPKIIQATSNREKEPSKFLEEKKKALESIMDSKGRSVMQVKDESMRNANQSCDKRQLCFVWSSLAALQIESIKKLAVLFGASCTHNFTPAVTHVIVSTKEENNAATKTLKFLQGIAYRKFVVGFKWVADCLKEGRLLDEEPYEAVDCYTLEPGPRKSRLRHRDLFEGFAFLCIEPFLNITVTQCQDLLRGVGATVVQSIGALATVRDMYKVILLQNEKHKDEVVADWYKKTSAIAVSCDWIVECISQYRLMSCYMYLHEIVPEDILKSGYPEEMIDPEEFNSTCDTSAGH